MINLDNDNFIPKRRVISQGPSKEYQFKPSIKIFDTTLNNNTKYENL